MFVSECFCWEGEDEDDSDHQSYFSEEDKPFSLPSPLPRWPQGQGFGNQKINLGEIEVVQMTKFERIWNCTLLQKKRKGATFYRPLAIPDGYFCLGHHCQRNEQPLKGYLLVARDVCTNNVKLPALMQPHGYSLIWSSDSDGHGCCYVWLPIPSEGYNAMGFIVTDKPEEPKLNDIRCVREDLTDSCQTYDYVLSMNTKSSKTELQVWNVRPSQRGLSSYGVSVGSFFCSTNFNPEEALNIACLKNQDPTLYAMPNLNQIHALIQQYGPTVFFHPDEIHFPSSVQWFFKNGAVLCREGSEKSEPINYRGSNLPSGGQNDGKYWIDLPDNYNVELKNGDIESAELYVHVKPALGGTFTDIAMWIFCPFNGPATIKVGLVSVEMSKIGQHVGDWEHFTLRISNFTGELHQVYFSQHSGGEWVDSSDLEFIEGNKAIVYSSKNGHSSYPHPGTYLQGSSKLGIGARNDVARSKYSVDSSRRYRIVAAEYIGEGEIEEPCWLHYMREWGPRIKYDSRAELDRLMDLLPQFVRFSVENIVDLFPTELYGEEGPTGPKEKNNWAGDERC